MGILYDNLPLIAAAGGYFVVTRKTGGLTHPKASIRTLLYPLAGYVAGVIAQEVIKQNAPSLMGYRTSLGVSDIGVQTGKQSSGAFVF